MKNISSGIYRLECLIDDKYAFTDTLFGALSSVLFEAGNLSDGREWRLKYLKTEEDSVRWAVLNIEKFDHYHGAQQEFLHHLMYIAEAPLSGPGFAKLGAILELPPSRIKDSLRRASSSNYRPFSDIALLYIRHRLSQSSLASKLELQFTTPIKSPSIPALHP